MKDRTVKILVALGLIALVAWIYSNTSFKEVDVRMPLQGEAARNPFYAAIRMSEELGAEAAWERVFTAPPADSVILLSQWNWTLSRPRRERIQQWVEAGGRLVVDDSLIGAFEEFESWSGVGQLEQEFDEDEDSGDTEAAEETENVESSDDAERPGEAEGPDDTEAPEQTEADESNETPARQDDNSIVAGLFGPHCMQLSENGGTRQYEVCGVDTTRSLVSARKTLWSLRDGQTIHALRTAVGRGSVTVINASPFRYRDFLLGDHPQLFVTLTQLRQGDALLFLTEEDRASLLSLIWRFGAPAVLLLLAGIALALWRSSPRFGPAAAPTEAVRRSLAEQIRGTGRFALRFGGGEALHTATVRALRDAAVRRLPTYDRMSSAERVAALAKLGGVSADELAPALNFSGRRNAHELRQAIAFLESVRRRISTKAQSNKDKHGN